MMEQVRAWLLSVLAAALFLGVLESVIPKGAVRQVGRLAVGLVLTLVLCRPLAGWLPGALRSQWEQAQSASVSADNSFAEVSEDYLSAVMSQRSAEYIQSAADGLGASVTASVTCRWEGELPVPEAAEISGSLSEDQRQSLVETVSTQLDIPAERIRFQEVEP